MTAVLPTDEVRPDMIDHYLWGLLEPTDPFYRTIVAVMRRASTNASMAGVGQRVRQWLRWCKLSHLDPLAVTRDDVQDWLETKRHLSPETQKSLLTMLRGLYREALSRELVRRDPTAALRIGRYTPPETRALSLEEAQLIIDSIRVELRDPDRRLAAARDYLIFSTLLTMGPRASELRRLTFSDFRLSGTRPTAHIYGKFRQHHDVGTSALVREALDVYERALEDAGIEIAPEDPICLAMGGNARDAFYGPRGDGRRPMSGPAFYAIVRARLEQVGLSGRKMGAHRLRKTAATLAWRAGADPVDIQHLLGHARLSTTLEHYIAPEQRLDRTAADLIPLAPAGLREGADR